MSVPAFAWAFDQGKLLNLPTNDRIVLLYLADKANGLRVAWPSQETICDYTGLAERAVRTSTHRLAVAGLIRIEPWGKSRRYHVLRPINGEDHVPTPAPRAAITPAPDAAEPAPRAGVQRTTPALDARTPALSAKTPARRADKPSKNQVKNQEARVPAREPSVSENLGVGRKSPPATPAPSADAPPDPEPTQAAIQAMRQRQLEDIAAMPAPMAAAIRSLANAFEAKFHGPGRWPERDPDTQRAAVAPVRPKTAIPPSAMLAALRQRAGIRAMIAS